MKALKRRTGSHTIGIGFVFCALISSSGCYGYFNAQPEAIEQGEQVRLVLSDGGRQKFAFGAEQPSVLEGDLVKLTPDSAAVAVWIGQAYRGTAFETARQTITLPRDQIQQFQRRELSTLRTAGTAIAAVGLVVALISQVEFHEDPNPPGGPQIPPPPPTAENRVLAPVLRIPFGWHP